MCTVSIKVNDSLLEMAGISKDSGFDIAEWMQKQIEDVLIEMALSAKRNAHKASHPCDSHEQSQEILAMTPKRLHHRHEALCGIFNSNATQQELLEEYLQEKYNV